MKFIKILANGRHVIEIMVPDEFEIVISNKPSVQKESESVRHIDLTPRGNIAVKQEEAEPEPEQGAPTTSLEIDSEKKVEAVKAIREEVREVEDVIKEAFGETEKSVSEPEKEESVITEITSKELEMEIAEHVTEDVGTMIGAGEEKTPDEKNREEKAKELLDEILEFSPGE